MISLFEYKQFLIESTKKISFNDENYFQLHHLLRQRNNEITMKYE